MRKNLLTSDTIKNQIAFDQPLLEAQAAEGGVCLSGTFIVATAPADSAGGPIAQFEVSIVVPSNFPRNEPEVFETGGRIPRVPDRHCNPNGACCTGVWEEWLVASGDLSVRAFLEGPVRNFFLSQLYFENHGTWPFGERAHGGEGIVEACVDILGVKRDPKLILRYLRVLAGAWPKGHWQCPCGSANRIRNCHRDQLLALHAKMSPHVARILFNKLRPPRVSRSQRSTR